LFKNLRGRILINIVLFFYYQLFLPFFSLKKYYLAHNLNFLREYFIKNRINNYKKILKETKNDKKSS